MVIISVIKTTKQNKTKTESKSPSYENEQKTNHEFNNFATHYHMLISKHIHVNKQILFFLPSYYIKSLVRQLTAQTTIFFLSISVRFFAEEKDKNQYKINTSKTIAKMKQS